MTEKPNKKPKWKVAGELFTIYLVGVGVAVHFLLLLALASPSTLHTLLFAAYTTYVKNIDYEEVREFAMEVGRGCKVRNTVDNYCVAEHTYLTLTNFTYATLNSIFATPPLILKHKTCDCDTCSLTFCSILNVYSIPCRVVPVFNSRNQPYHAIAIYKINEWKAADFTAKKFGCYVPTYLTKKLSWSKEDWEEVFNKCRRK